MKLIINNGILERVENYNGEKIIKIPDGVTTIGAYAFKSCDKLTKIEIPNSVIKILSYAFEGCSKLVNVELPNSINSIWNGVFKGCSSLKKIVLPSSVVSIDSEVFMNCSSLEEVELSNSILTIGDKSFLGCEKMTKIELPDSVISIGREAFTECCSLKEIVLPKNIKVIWKGTFKGCSSITKIKIPDNVNAIEDKAFMDCSSLENVELPSKLEKINSYTFRGCTNLKTIKIPEGVKSIGQYAFMRCSSLEKFKIPENIKNINNYTFRGCTNLKTITIPKGVISIGRYAFMGCSSLENVDMPSSINLIDQGAFMRCSSLKNVKIPDGVVEIKEKSFCECDELAKIKIPEKVTKILKQAFSNCHKLEIINGFPKKLSEIGQEAFSNCGLKDTIKIPDSVKNITNGAFQRCKYLKNVELGEGVKDISTKAFKGCSNFIKIYVSTSLKNVEENAFPEKVKFMVPLNKLQNIKKEKIDNIETVLFNLGEEESDDKEFVNISQIFEAFPGINLKLFLDDKEKFKYLVSSVKYKDMVAFTSQDIKKYEDFESFIEKLKENKIPNFEKIFTKLLNNISNQDKSDKNKIFCLFKLAQNIGLFEEKKEISIKAYNILENAFKKNLLTFNDNSLLDLFKCMKKTKYNEGLLNFISQEINLEELKILRKEKNTKYMIKNIWEWFERRSQIQFPLSENDNVRIPTTEENRYKIAVYTETENGVELKWVEPTIENFVREFHYRKYKSYYIKKEKLTEDLALTNYMNGFFEYKKDDIEKAKKILNQTQKEGFRDHITDAIVTESLEKYKKISEELNGEVAKNAGEIINNQANVASKIFTYEMLAKSDKANLAMGYFTTCCATLCNVGVGALTYMMLHPDMQPLVIRNNNSYDKKIIAFGIIYVNRKEGYAVVNDIEINEIYDRNKAAAKDIYESFINGINDFVEQYNKENKNKPITIVTCGRSPRSGNKMNDFLEKNTQKKLKAPIFTKEESELGIGELLKEEKEIYEGDWVDSDDKPQYIIWSCEEKEKQKKANGR